MRRCRITTSDKAVLNFRRGDVNIDGSVDLADVLAILFNLFKGQAIHCRKGADVDDGGSVTIADAIYLLEFLFLSYFPPVIPYPGCGQDPSWDSLPCEDGLPCS